MEKYAKGATRSNTGPRRCAPRWVFCRKTASIRCIVFYCTSLCIPSDPDPGAPSFSSIDPPAHVASGPSAGFLRRHPPYPAAVCHRRHKAEATNCARSPSILHACRFHLRPLLIIALATSSFLPNRCQSSAKVPPLHLPRTAAYPPPLIASRASSRPGHVVL